MEYTFNPLQTLSEEQVKAIGARFNKTWLTPRMNLVESMQKEHGCGFFEAAFTVALQEDANNLIASKKIARVADQMYNLSSELFGSEEYKKAALVQIETAYENLDSIQQTSAGKRFRQLVLKGYTSKQGLAILQAVCEKLDVREVAWI